MHRFTSYIAILLLLLFTRVMVPDALLLELHPHTHTIDSDHSDTHKAQVGKKHKHCPVEDLFDASFQGTITQLEVRHTVHQTTYTNFYQTHPHSSSSSFCQLRGPPAIA
ncbi:MAG TPA: hypothetical protein VIG72_03220 [Pontibacter sp.]